MAKPIRIILVILILTAHLFFALPLLALTADEQKLLSSISGENIKSTVQELCSDRYAGRKAGSPGEALAAQYIIDRFQNLQLHSIAGSYTQDFTMKTSLVKSVDDIKATLVYKAGVKDVRQVFAYPEYYGRGGVDLKIQVVFVGGGVTDKSSGRDDYRGINVKGKIAVWMAGNTNTSRPASSISSRILNAYQHGAAGSLVVGLRDPISHKYGGYGLAGPIADFPCLSILPETAKLLFPGTWPQLAHNRKTQNRLGATVSIKTAPVYNPAQPTQNVFSMLPGLDGGELILLGAHYDHLGANGPNKIFRGADDNASGAAVMLAVADAFAKSGLKPKYGIVFAAWAAEEVGLVGSNHFANSPPFALNKLKAAVNVDMVGVGDVGKYKTAGSASCPLQYHALYDCASELDFSIEKEEVRAASDHLAFSRKGIPSMLVHSAGEHPNMHTTRDCPELIDPKILENTAKLVALTIWRLAK
ncbi:MAG: M20/M25/M40 family metallo-hydrolase [Armatimonadota bacterium]|nr:M20/M25/M40 family metallo-hydrolase [Armatimonadota bacterium]